MNLKTTVLVLVGTDTENKHHAARFDASDEAVVRKAASLMGFRLGRAETEEARALAKQLPDGKIFGTGKAFVPLVKEDLGRKLLGALVFIPTNGATDGTADSKAAAVSNGKQAATAHASHDPWSEIKVGSVVLCRESGNDEPSWWESVVVAIAKDNESMTMRWRDYPDVKKFNAKRHAVGLLRPAPRR